MQCSGAAWQGCSLSSVPWGSSFYPLVSIFHDLPYISYMKWPFSMVISQFSDTYWMTFPTRSALILSEYHGLSTFQRGLSGYQIKGAIMLTL
jgi:hypothetical protein